MQNKLSKNIVFAKCFEPYDFTENFGQLAVEIEYTDGSTDMLTTPMDPKLGNDRGDFKDEVEYYQFLSWLKEQDVKRK